MNKSRIGGYLGRQQGLDFENYFDSIMKTNNNYGYRKLINYDGERMKSLLVRDMLKWENLLTDLKINEEWLYNFLKDKKSPKDDKRACDIIVFYEKDDKIQYKGFDTKKSQHQHN